MKRSTSLGLLCGLVPAVIGLWTVAGTVHADLVTIDTFGTISMAANSQSSAVILPIYDFNPSISVTDLSGVSLGLRVVRLTGTGTVTIDQASIAYASNNIIASGDQFGIISTSNSPTSGDYTYSLQSAGFNGYTVPNQASEKNTLTLKFNSSAGASGQFALELVNGASNGNSNWTDNTAFLDHPLYVFNGVGDVAVDSTHPGVVGTINISAVPEPGSLALVGALAAAGAWRARRKRSANRSDSS